MKQLDLILCAVAIVIGIVGSWIVWAMKPNPEPAPRVKIIDTSTATLPAAPTAYSPNLPGGSGGAMGRGGKKVGALG